MALDNKAFGRRVKYYRTERSLSQEELANLIGITHKYLGHIETGIKTPSLELLILIANALEVSANDLLADSLNHSSSSVDRELHDIFYDCNHDEKGILMKTLHFLKALLSEFGI